ncbi:hypothetical protein OZX61_11930 (plasmid) [Acinetobacter sp. ESL0695]|nr:hypothetical protein [Acinetobacter sp. ESL0695]WEV50100.1 hypothetical protein OZX61_11930 [Acinetobacter sp. ESL0695]
MLKEQEIEIYTLLIQSFLQQIHHLVYWLQSKEVVVDSSIQFEEEDVKLI